MKELVSYNISFRRGLDHILFVLSLYLLSPKLKLVVWQATTFTVGHSVTLGLSIHHVIKPPANIVEPVVALSILHIALENIFSPKLKKSRTGIVFLFRLVHGMGFARVLGQLGLPGQSYLTRGHNSRHKRYERYIFQKREFWVCTNFYPRQMP